MKSSNVFWGAFLLTCGVLLLLFNLDAFSPDISGCYKFWPVLLILGGIAVLKIPDIAKKILSGIVGAALAFILISGIISFFGFLAEIPEHVHIQTTHSDSRHSESYESISLSDTEAGELNLELGASSLFLKGGSPELIEIHSEEGILDTRLNREDKFATVDISGSTISLNDNNIETESMVILNSDIPWDIDLDCGATSAKFDLSAIAVPEFEINSGMSSISIIMGDKQPEADIYIKNGMSNFSLTIPKNSGCRIQTDGVFSQKINYGDGQDDMWIKKPGIRETKNYAESENRIHLYLEGAFSNISVKMAD